MRFLASVCAACALLVGMTNTASAQNVTLSSDFLKEWRSQKDMMMKIADAMPADKFGYKSTPAQRTYGEQILHVAGANILLMRFLGGQTTSPAISQTDQVTFGLKGDTKAETLKQLSESFDYGEAVLKEFDDAAMTQAVAGPPWIGRATRARLAAYVMGHTQDIYGQMVVYLRLNGIVPPASRRGGV